MAQTLHKLIFTLISGFTEFLSVSAFPHQTLYQLMTGYHHTDLWLSLAIRVGVLTAVLLACSSRIKHLRRENRLSKRSRRRGLRQADPVALMDLRLLKTATIPVLISILFYRRSYQWISGVALLAPVLVVNGVILFIPRLMSQGDKDGRAVSALDGILVGLGGAFGAIPGLSRMGCTLSIGQARGFDRSYALDTALLLSIPALLGLLIFDIYAAFAAKVGVTALALFGYLCSAALSCASAYLGILLMRFLSAKTGWTWFAYYSWGAALFSFILYLVI